MQTRGRRNLVTMRVPADLDDRPWEKPGAIRRDWAPHRGRFLSRLAAFSSNLGVFALPFTFIVVLCIPTALAAIGLGGVAWALARRDLRAMGANRSTPPVEGWRGTAWSAA
jgi:hypothetical protein